MTIPFFFRPILLLTVFALSACATLDPQSQSLSKSPPNIVFIMADDLGYGDLGCYGQKEIKTPHIDKLAAEGMRFTDAYAGDTVCAPSRCSLLTGLNTGHAFIRGNAKVNLRPAPQDLTVTEILHTQGYQTMCAGKWGLGAANSAGTPVKKGFDYFYGFIDQTHAHNSYTDFLYQNDTRITLRNVVPNPGPYGQGIATVQVDFVGDLFDQQTVHYMENMDAKRPFFIYASYTAPHANDESKSIEVPDLGQYADKPWPDPEKRYAALITRLDTYVGNIMKVLHDRGLDDNTVVIFTSDNGPQEEGGNTSAYFDSGGPLKGVKRDLYEGGIRIPFIARWTGHIQPSTVTALPIAFYDVPATAAQLAGAPPIKDTDGLSFLPTLLNDPADQQHHDFLYWEFHENGFHQAVRMRGTPESGDWKAVRHGLNQPIELYNLKSDIGEKTNVAAAHPDIVAKITAYLATCRTKSAEFPVPGE